jgi:hypothetical protein
VAIVDAVEGGGIRHYEGLTMIAVGTLCYIIRTSVGNEDLLGRVVELISSAQQLPERGGVAMDEIDSEWLHTEHPRCRCFAAAWQLLPIAAPGKPPIATRKREPETT